MSDAEELEAARVAWQGHEHERALELLSAVWAKGPNAQLSQAIEQISRRLVRALERELFPLGAGAARRELYRRARAGERVAVHAVLGQLPDPSQAKRSQLTLAMLDPGDPVVVRALARVLLTRPEHNTLAEYLRLYAGPWLLGQQRWWLRDASHEAFVNSRLMRETSGFHIRRRHRERPWAALGPEALEQLAALATLVDPESEQARALRVSLFAEPHSHAARAVFADKLAECGDPRGEFIQIQLARATGEGSEALASRERELLDTHGHAWAGELMQLSVATRFEAGFITGVALDTRASTADRDALAGRPEWESVERLDGGTAAIVTDPAMRSLLALRCDDDCAATLFREREQLESLRSLGIYAREHQTSQSRAAGIVSRSLGLEAITSLPALEHFEMLHGYPWSADGWRWLWTLHDDRLSLRSVGCKPSCGSGELPLDAFVRQMQTDACKLVVWLQHGDLRFGIDVRGERPSLALTRMDFPWFRGHPRNQQQGWVLSILSRLRELGRMTLYVSPTLLPSEGERSFFEREQLDAHLDIRAFERAPAELTPAPWP